MRVFFLALGLCLITSLASADVVGKVISYEKETINGNPIIKVTSEYIYPDGTKHQGVTRYQYSNFSKANVEKDVQAHCETIIQYYIQENVEIQATKKNAMIDGFITSQNNAIGTDKITNITYTLKNLYLDDLDITLQGTGTTKDVYK